ncbi:MAG: DUF3267 domain-containing protein [Bacteroidales bacterium]|jgi:hypothetical protein|nr:DUF3267 domain-containing protein [Bacteroidales bacterium]
MNNKPSIEELEEGGTYEKVLTLRYDELAPFVISGLRTLTLPMMLVWTVAIISAALTLFLWPRSGSGHNGPGILPGLAAGLILIPLLLVPVHELLHLIPFRLAGARDIRVGADLRQGIVYVTAHRFVAGLNLFAAVALTPFLVITASLVAVMFFVPPWWQWVLTLALLAHTTMCAGDAALLGHLGQYRGRKVYTWDDAGKKEAYFYASKVA